MPRRRPGWIPIFHPETRQNNNSGSGFDSVKTGRTLVFSQRFAPFKADFIAMTSLDKDKSRFAINTHFSP